MRALFPRLSLRHLGAVCGAIALASGCVAANGADNVGLTPPREAGITKPNKVTTVDSGSTEGGGPLDGGLLINRLCGTADYCLNHGTPDDELACAQYDAGSRGTRPRPDGGVALRDASNRVVTDSGDASLDGALADAGREGSDASRFASAADAGDVPPELVALPIPEPADSGPGYACQVSRDDSDRPVHQCVPSGSGGRGSPCTQVNDCAPGLACVGAEWPKSNDASTAETGQCFPYCCDESRCRKWPGTYCAERRLLDGTAKKPLIVPVCSPGSQCRLLEPYPCEGAGCSCPPSTSCTVVGGDGTRGCVKPGTGKIGDSCPTAGSPTGGPCAAGYYCSLATSTCQKMCKTDGIDDSCAPGRCQAAAGFPGGFGLCVGYTPAKQ